MVHTPIARSAVIRPGGKLLVWSGNETSGIRLLQEARRGGFQAEYVSNLTEVRRQLTQENIAVCILDEPHSIQTVRELTEVCRQAGGSVQFVVLPPLGASYIDSPDVPDHCDILRPPLSLDKLAGALFRAAARARVIEPEEEPVAESSRSCQDLMTGCSSAMKTVREQVRDAASKSTPLLIMGEKGCGTNVTARAVHNAQFPVESPFVVVRCSVLTGAAMEQELFGNDAGDDGLWEAAAGGTLLLDDVDEISLAMQARLVKRLAQRASTAKSCAEGSRGEDSQPPRVIATTHIDLESRVREGRFDPELLRLLKQGTILVPALRDRTEDIPALASEILIQVSQREGRPLCRLADDAIEILRGHHWPGNVRELENILARCCALNTGADISAQDITPWIEREQTDEIGNPGLTLREMERKLIEATFNRYAGNREMTAKALQIGLRTLSGKLREYGYPPRGGPGSNRIRRAA